MKNGAELLDRLIKDIVSESAASYVSVLDNQTDNDNDQDDSLVAQRAFKLPEFIPLLQQRIYVLNPFTRTFLVNWITLLDSIPDLELVSYLIIPWRALEVFIRCQPGRPHHNQSCARSLLE